MFCYVVLHYLAEKSTIEVVDTLLDNVTGEKKIIIVDNDSPNDSLQKLKKYYSGNDGVEILHSKTNLGFAKGNNFGYKYAINKYSPSFIVVMNNDLIILQKDFQNIIINEYKNNKFGILGPDIIANDGTHQNPKLSLMASRKYATSVRKKEGFKLKHTFYFKVRLFIKGLTRTLKKSVDNRDVAQNKDQENPVLHGSMLVFSTLFFDKFKYPFFAGTFMYFESEILSYFLRLANLKSTYCPDVQVRHLQNVSTKEKYSNSFLRAQFMSKNMVASTDAFIKYVDGNSPYESPLK